MTKVVLQIYDDKSGMAWVYTLSKAKFPPLANTFNDYSPLPHSFPVPTHLPLIYFGCKNSAIERRYVGLLFTVRSYSLFLLSPDIMDKFFKIAKFPD